MPDITYKCIRCGKIFDSFPGYKSDKAPCKVTEKGAPSWVREIHLVKPIKEKTNAV